MGHLTEDVLERFLSLSTDAEENRSIVVHLLSGCPRCSAAARQLVFPPASSEAANHADLTAPGELVDKARYHLSSALSDLDQLQACLTGNEPLLPPVGRINNVVSFTDRKTFQARDGVGAGTPRNAS